MEADTATRYRSRILREMKANRDNPFNSPPSSTGSHGTVSPTLSSVFSDPDGESTRRLNEDIARVTTGRKMPVNWDAAHRKWPEFFSAPSKRDAPIFDDMTDTRPLSAGAKENKPPLGSAVKFTVDDDTQETWMGSQRTRAEMQPRVDNESDISSILSKSPARALSQHRHASNQRHPSPLAKVQNRTYSPPASKPQRRPSISDALDRLRRASTSPNNNNNKRHEQQLHDSPHLSSAKSSLTAVHNSPGSMASHDHNASNVRSFFMPDVSHLGDFVTGTLRFTGSNKQGVPIFVKHGKVHDERERPAAASYAEVDGLDVPKDEEKIFVSMDMIREEILSLQGHYDKVQEYAENLQQQVEHLEAQLKSQKKGDWGYGSDKANEQIVAQKNRLEVEVATLQSRLEQASRKISLNEIENESAVQEKDRALRKLQEACDDINKLTRKLNHKERELETSHRQLETTEQFRQDNDTLRRDLVSLKHGRDALELENNSLREEADRLRKHHQSLINENISLRSSNESLVKENEELRDNLDGAQHELDAAREEIDDLRQEVENNNQEKTSLREDNESLVRHNEKYFSENKILRRENSGFERSVGELQDDNEKLKDEVELLKEQLDHKRPLQKDGNTIDVDDETEENMTSAFFIPDITMNTDGSKSMDITQTGEMPAPPELTSQSNKFNNDATEQDTRSKLRRSSSNKSSSRQRSQSRTRKASRSSVGQKVSFSVPDDTEQITRASSNMANQGSKRRSGPLVRDFGNVIDDSTGMQSFDNMTQEFSVSLNPVPVKGRKEGGLVEDHRRPASSQGHRSQRTASQSKSTQKQHHAVEMTSESVMSAAVKESCPALSNDARRVLDGLCEHNCRNCTVCTRITSHRGTMSSSDLAIGKKRVTVPRPVPVTDRDLSVEDPTMRPVHSPGHALAMVIKSLEDESQHLQLELSRLQAQYNSSDKALGRRDRLSMAEGIRTLLKRLEAKNDQIYSLYDVLEGQKAAQQAMSEEEIEMTVLNITGMTVRDVTGGTENLTWEGIDDA